MNCIAIIAEYNPFHTGHLYLLQTLRRQFGEDAAIIIMMSGSFVQRGEPALFDKWTRAAWALEGGADCVVELPVLYALSSAEGFASGAVRLAARMGCTHLACGVEHGSAASFYELAAACSRISDAFHADTTGITYGEYISQQLEKELPAQTAALLRKPNALLAAEYVKAMQNYAPAMKFIPIRRQGMHDGPSLSGPFASASAIRRTVQEGTVQAIEPYIPPYERSALQRLWRQGRYTDYSRYGDLVLYRSRLLSPSDLRSFPAFSEGLENRWHRILQQSSTWPEALAALKTKRYAYSRLCRMGAYTVLSIRRADMEQAYEQGPQYGRILALSALGAAAVKKIKKEFPLVTKVAADGRHLSAFGQTMLHYDLASTDIQAFCSHAPSNRRGQKDWHTSPYIAMNRSNTCHTSL